MNAKLLSILFFVVSAVCSQGFAVDNQSKPSQEEIYINSLRAKIHYEFVQSFAVRLQKEGLDSSLFDFSKIQQKGGVAPTFNFTSTIVSYVQSNTLKIICKVTSESISTINKSAEFADYGSDKQIFNYYQVIANATQDNNKGNSIVSCIPVVL